jgi:hypothetical protein
MKTPQMNTKLIALFLKVKYIPLKKKKKQFSHHTYLTPQKISIQNHMTNIGTVEYVSLSHHIYMFITYIANW